MKARLVASLPQGKGWLLEIKLDGIRAVAVKDGSHVKLFSRKPRDISSDYPDVVAALEGLPVEDVVLDGEVVALNASGKSSFQLLQNRKRPGKEKPSIFYYLFDLLNLDGRDFTSLPLETRKKALAHLLEAADDPLRFSAHLDAEPAKVWKEIQRLSLEGIVAKRADSVYEPGRRSGAWLKVKNQNEQEFVIGGYTPPKGSRSYFGALLVGYYQKKRLIFSSKVGTGFTNAQLKLLHDKFRPLLTQRCPFDELPEARSGRSETGLTKTEMKKAVWIRPELVGQIRFTEWTRDGNLRHPVFLGLREDKKPTEVVRETPEP